MKTEIKNFVIELKSFIYLMENWGDFENAEKDREVYMTNLVRMYNELYGKDLSIKEFKDDETLMEKASKIVDGNAFNDSETRKYPPFEEALETISLVSSRLLRKNISAYDVCIIMTVLKLDRDGFQPKPDNKLDAVAYLAMTEKVDKR